MPPPQILFFDIDADLIEAYQKTLAEYPFVRCEEINMNELLEKHRISALISPANSYGYMDGGIDKVYSRMFKGIESRVMAAIKTLGFKDRYQRAFCPIGRAVNVPLFGYGDRPERLIAAPTMVVPSNIEGTPENIYLAMTAILEEARNFPEEAVIAIPGLGTGCGNVDPAESAAQIKRALVDFIAAQSVPVTTTQTAYGC